MLKLEVVTPQKKALETEVDSVTLPGSEGELGILPDHIPLLTTLDTGIVSYTNGSQKQILVVHWGYAQVEGERVTILAELAESVSEIDGDLEAWFDAENEAMKKIAIMRRRETLLSAWADLERRLEINRSQRVSELKNRLRSFTDQDIVSPDIDSIESELLKEWDRIVESAASSIVDG